MTVVLDSQGLSILARSQGSRSDNNLVLEAVTAAAEAGREVLVPAAVLAELYRGGSHDQVVGACLSRFPAIVVIPTGRRLARTIGHLLARAGRGSADHVDASVVAVAVRAGGGVIATSDVDDLTALAEGLPRVRVVGV